MISGIGNQETPNNLTLETEAMQHRAVILKKYLDAKVERETQALFALQTLVHKLEHPNSKFVLSRIGIVSFKFDVFHSLDNF